MQEDLTLQAYHYDLPEENIAHHPAQKRDHSRLLVLDRTTGAMEHGRFEDIVGLIEPGDILVVNDTRVFPARLTGRKETGGKAEVFLLGYPSPASDAAQETDSLVFECEALIKSSRPPRPGSEIHISPSCRCIVLKNSTRGKWFVRLLLSATRLEEMLAEQGSIPLPPYIKRPNGPTEQDAQRYQTVYARQPGAVAAPTAGLHFTDELLGRLERKGIRKTAITLHVGYGTFAPVQDEDITRHGIHREYIEISEQTATLINRTKETGKKVWAVGTTTVRALEYAAGNNGLIRPAGGWCDLYIFPGFRFRIVDNLITNFHLPGSSLMFLVSALCGREQLLTCYREAVEKGYRFYSYGDAMAITSSAGHRRG